MADTFRGDNARLCESIDALLSLDASGSLAHGIGGHARTLLESAATRLRALSPAGVSEEMVKRGCAALLKRWGDCEDLSEVTHGDVRAVIEAAIAAAPQPQDAASGQTPTGAGGDDGALPEPFGFYDAVDRTFRLFAPGADPHLLDCFPEVTYLYSRATLTATSADTTGDSEDAARLDAALDAARRARGEGNG